MQTATDDTKQTTGVWVCFMTRPLKEQFVTRWLERAGIECTLPMEARRVRRSRHQKAEPKTIYRVALRSYVFVFIPDDRAATDIINLARMSPFIGRNPVGVRGKPLCIRFRNWEYGLHPRGLDPDRTVPAPGEPPPPPLGYAVGDDVVLTEAAGSFSGLRGKVENIRDDEVDLAVEGLRFALLQVRPTHAVKATAEKLAA